MNLFWIDHFCLTVLYLWGFHNLRLGAQPILLYSIITESEIGIVKKMRIVAISIKYCHQMVETTRGVLTENQY